MLLRFKDFAINEKKTLDLHIDERNNLKYQIATGVLKSYELVGQDSIKLTFFNDKKKRWETVVKYLEMHNALKDTDFFYYENKEFPFSKIIDLLKEGKSLWYNKLKEDFTLTVNSTMKEIKNGTVSLWIENKDIGLNYVPLHQPLFKITKSGNIYQTNKSQTFKQVSRMNCLEDYETALKLLYDTQFKRYMLELKRWDKNHNNNEIEPEHIKHAKKLKYPTLKGFVKIGIF
jgi:hypothetical protein